MQRAMPKTPRRGRTPSPSNRSERSEVSVPNSCFRQFSTGSMSSVSSSGKVVTNRELREARYEHEAKLEAERHWWLERSEGQVKELQTVFGAEFEKTSLHLNARIAACQERFEQLLEKEKEERQAALVELRASFGSQVASTHQLGKAGDKGAFEHQLREVHGLMGQLRNDHALSMTQQAERHATLTADQERQRELISSLEVSMQVLKNDLAKNEAASFELQDVRLSIRQTADASSKGIDEVSRAVAESERNLRLEMQAAVAALGSAEGGLRQELCDGLAAVEAKLALQIGERIDAIGQSARKLAQSIDDERDQRVLESNTMRSKLDAVASQLEISIKASSAPHSSASRAEIDVFSEQVKSLQDSLHEERAKHAAVASDAALHSEQIVTIDRLLSALSEQVSSLREASSAYEKRSAEDLATERNARAAETLEIRLLAEEASRQAQFAHTAATTAAVASSPPGGAPHDAAAVAAAGAEAKVALDQVHTELAAVRRSIQEVDAACRRCERANGEARGNIQELGRMAPRVEALEEVTRKHAAAAMKVEALEMDVRQMSRESDMRRLEAEVRRFNTGLAPLAQRMEAVEEDVRRTTLDTSPLMARVAAIENENKRLLRDNGPMSVHLEALRSEVAAFKSRLLDGPPAGSVQLPAGRGPPLSARSITPCRSSELFVGSNGIAAKAIHPAKAAGRSLEKLSSAVASAEASRTEAPSSTTPATSSGSQLQVINKMHALHHQNIALREGNAELEEILAHEVVRLGRPSANATGNSNPAVRPGRLSRSPMLKAGRPVPESPATSPPASTGPVSISNQGAVQRSESIRAPGSVSLQAPGSGSLPGYGSPPRRSLAIPPAAGQAKLRHIVSQSQQQGLGPLHTAPIQMRASPTAVPKPYSARK